MSYNIEAALFLVSQKKVFEELRLMHPAINLGVAALLTVIGYFALRPHYGWLWRWQRQGQPERIRIEDALKYLYSLNELGQAGSIDSVAGALEISRNGAAQLALQLEQRGLAWTSEAGLKLTDEGESYALQVIRTHRLWEQYLAEETGVGEGEWHQQADLVEHRMTPAEADALAARMGDPVFDPHGDPIPTATGVVQRPSGVSLNAVEPRQMVRIVHIEDEPDSTYQILREAHLQSGMALTVLRSSEAGVEIDTGVAHCTLVPLVAANVTVQVLDDCAAGSLSLRRLSSLALGEQATVTDISPGCRGVERRRLLDLGLVPGTAVKAEFASPGGDPVAYRVRGALIALRAQQASMIHIGVAAD